MEQSTGGGGGGKGRGEGGGGGGKRREEGGGEKGEKGGKRRGEGEGRRGQGQALYQGLLQALLVAAVEFLGLPRGAHRPVQSLPQVHEAILVPCQLVSGTSYQRLVPLPAAGQLLLHTGQHWPRPSRGMVIGAVTPVPAQPPSALPR